MAEHFSVKFDDPYTCIGFQVSCGKLDRQTDKRRWKKTIPVR